MSYLRAGGDGVYNIPALNASGQLYIRGKKFEDYIAELMSEDQLEQSEIDTLRTLLLHLKTDGLTSEWIVNNENKNAVLKTAITAIETKLAKIDTAALTETSVLTNDNRNSVLKTAIDTAASDLTALTTRVATAETDIDNLETRMTDAEGDINTAETNITGILAKTKYIEVNDGDYNDPDTINSISIGYVPNSGTTLAKHKKAYFGLGGLSQGILFEHIDQELDDLKIYNVFGPTTLWSQHNTFMSANTDIGFVNQNVGSYGETINIGSAMSRINIGSVETPKIGTGFPIPDSDYNNSTKITIGKRTALKNTWTYLAGNFYTSESRWEDLAVTDVVTFETAASWFAGYVFSGGLPYWLAWVGLSGTPNYRYSDIVKMANNYQTGGLTKNHAIETSNDISVKNIRVMDFTVVSLSTAFDAILARLVFQAFAVHGSHSIGSIWGRTNIYAGSGEVELRVDGGAFDWAFKNAGNCNRVFLDNDHVEVVQCNGSGGTGRLRLVAAAGNIELSTGYGGVRANASKIMEITYLSQIIIGEDTTMTDTTYKMLIDTTSHTNGIKVAKGTNALLLNPDNVSSKSLTLQSDYTGTTVNTLYKNADNKLFWNGTEVGAGGVSSGGITYMINVASNITNPNPTPTETIIAATYSGNAQRTITQAVATNTAYYIAKYTTEVFDEASNPVLTGLQQLNQYLVWNSQTHTGQLYGQLWFQATAIGFGVLYQRTYASPVTTTAATFINGTPIPTPKGLYNIKFQRVVFPNINLVVSSGSVALRYRVEGYDFFNGWTTLTSMGGTAPPTFSSSANNLTITLDSSQILNQTTSVGAKTAVRLVLYIDSGTGTISQTSAGGADLAAYSLIGLGVNTPGLFRTMLYDGTNAKINVPYSTTPTLVEYDLPIDAPYNGSAFASPTLSTDLYFIQAAGGFANHVIALYFNEGTISHYHSTISPPQTAPTLAQVLNIGATASQAINMNTNKISGITTLEGAANGNWNVKEITAAQGSGISVTPTNGSYAIANAGIISISSGTGISVSTSNGVAVITNTAAVTGLSENIRDEHQSLYEVGALPRKPDYWATNWSVADSTARSHQDIYVSVDGKIIATASGPGFAIRYSTNYGTSWNNGNVSASGLTWSSICGTSNGSKLFAFGRFIAQNQAQSLSLYSSTEQGATWTQVTSSAFTGLSSVNRVRCSGDGNYILANITNVGTQGRSLFSSDGGVTWVVKTISAGLPSGYTNGVAMSRSGAVQFMTWISDTGTNSGIFRSMDYGATWAQMMGHISGANFTHIECDATGRFVYATRYLNINSGGHAACRSEDYGATWVLAGMNSIEDIWVSGTGQFVVGVEVPNTSQSNNRFLAYSVDYGRTTQFLSLGNTTTFRTISGSADGSVLVLGSVNFTEGGFAGDGLIRIARQGQQNIQDFQVTGGGTISKANGIYSLNITSAVAAEELWASGSLITTTDTAFPFMDWSSFAGSIDLNLFNIRYEIDCYWNWNNATYPAAFIHIAPNNITASDYQTDPNTSSTFVGGVTHWTNMMAGGAWGGITGEFNQSYRNRFMGGFLNAITGSLTEQRCRTLLNGELRLQTRPTGQASFTTDPALTERNIFNRFSCNNYTTQSVGGTWLTYQTVGSDFQNSCMRVDGTATFAAQTYWSGYLAAGINRIGLRLNDGFTPSDTRPRGAQYIYRIYRVRKGVANSV